MSVTECLCSLALAALASFVGGFLIGLYTMYDDKVPTRQEIVERIDEQQMRLDLLIDMLKAQSRGEMNWDKL